jgi:glutaredoxin
MIENSNACPICERLRETLADTGFQYALLSARLQFVSAGDASQLVRLSAELENAEEKCKEARADLVGHYQESHQVVEMPKRNSPALDVTAKAGR